MAATKRVEAKRKVGTLRARGPRRMLSEAQVLEIVPISRTTLFRLEKAGRFPKSTYISPNRRVWYEDQLVSWQRTVNELDPARGRGKGRRSQRKAAAT